MRWGAVWREGRDLVGHDAKGADAPPHRAEELGPARRRPQADGDRLGARRAAEPDDAPEADLRLPVLAPRLPATAPVAGRPPPGVVEVLLRRHLFLLVQASVHSDASLFRIAHTKHTVKHFP